MKIGPLSVLQQIDELNKEMEMLTQKVKQLEREKNNLAMDADYLLSREEWLQENIEKVEEHHQLQVRITREKENQSLRQSQINREEKVLARETEHLALRKEWLEEKMKAEAEAEKSSAEEILKERSSLLYEEKQVDNMRNDLEMERQRIIEKKEAFQREVDDMIATREAFQLERDNMIKEREAFQREVVAQRMKRMAFDAENEKFRKEKEAFQLEMAEMAMMRKAYIKEKAGIQKMREAFREGAAMMNEQKNMSTDKEKALLKKQITPLATKVQNKEMTGNVVNASTKSSFISVWSCRDEQGNCGCMKKCKYRNRTCK